MLFKKKKSSTRDTAGLNEGKNGKKKKKILLLIPLVLILVLGIVLTQVVGKTRMFNSMSMETRVDEKVLKKNAEKSNIDTILSAYGSITDEEAVYVSLPDSVTITSYEVANGDYVSAGDVLARVDKTSTLLAITEVQNLLDKLDKELEESKEDAIDDEITANVPGKVKAVFVEADSKVVDAMYEHDALILISLDGQMAVEVETDAEISVGEAVKLTDKDGNTYTGKVAERGTKSVVITVSDEKTSYGETVEASLEDGTLLGSGTLYVHSEQKITGYSGRVKAVKVVVDDEVETGDTLLTLTDTNYLANYKALLEQRHVLENQMRELFVIYQSGTILAESDGLVANLDKSLIEESTGSKKTASNMSAARTGSITVSKMSCTRGSSKGLILAAANNSPVSTDEDVYDFAAEVIESGSSVLSLKVSGSPINLSDYTDISGIGSYLDTTSDLSVPSSAGIYQYSGGSWKSISFSSLSKGQLLVCTFDAQGNLLWIVAGDSAAEETPEEETTEAEEIPEVEESSEEESKEEKLPEESIPEETRPEESAPVETPAQDESESRPSGEIPEGDESRPSGEMPAGDESKPSGEMPAGDISFPSGEMPASESSAAGNGQGYSGFDLSGFNGTGGMTGVGGTTGSFGTAVGTTEEEAAAIKAAEKYAVSSVDLCTVTPQNQVNIDITVDESDILSLAVGNEAEVTLDALEGQSFTATVTKINPHGSNSGGSTKYTATVTMDRETDMLSGMNATVKFLKDTAENVLSIPVEALNESGSSVFVYTTYDEKEDVLGNPVEVKTGVSDGSSVEIIEGLNEGDAYYYRYADSISWSFTR